MTRLAIVVEGETEFDFVNKILTPYFSKFQITALNMRGGKISVPKIQSEIKNCLHSFDKVSTLVDYYRLKNPDQKNLTELEAEIKNPPFLKQNTLKEKIIPYIQKYEFESLLFADKKNIAEVLALDPMQKEKLHQISEEPEEINNENPPSKRLSKIYPRYSKRINGVEIIKKIGLNKICERCPRFAAWIEKLEQL